jgi:SAM-dependent methyltransferase
VSRVRERLRTPFNAVEVHETEGLISFEIAGATHAEWRPDRLLTRQAWDALAAAALLRPDGPARSVLLLGLGGGTGARILRALLPRARLTAVEIDPGMIALARRHMHLDALDLEVVVDEARAFLARSRRRFDVVLDDLYLAGQEDAYRPGGVDADIVAGLRRALRPGGVVGLNLITGPGHRHVQSRARAALRAAFPALLALRPPDSLNETLVAGERIAPLSTLRAAGAAFAHPRDRADWAALRARRLGS